IGGAGILHVKDVVNGAMVERRAVVKTMDDIEGHGLFGVAEDGGLVHVVPKAGNVHGDKILVERTPPIADTGEREIGKDTVAGPDRADIKGTVRILNESIVLDVGIVRGVAVVGIALDVKVRDSDEVKVLVAEIGYQFFKVEEV